MDEKNVSVQALFTSWLVSEKEQESFMTRFID